MILKCLLIPKLRKTMRSSSNLYYIVIIILFHVNCSLDLILTIPSTGYILMIAFQLTFDHWSISINHYH